MLGRRTNEREPMCFDHFGELGVLRQKAVSRVDRVRAGDLGSGKDLRLLQLSDDGAGPMQTLSYARRTAMASLSASEWTTTVDSPISLQAR